MSLLMYMMKRDMDSLSHQWRLLWVRCVISSVRHVKYAASALSMYRAELKRSIAHCLARSLEEVDRVGAAVKLCAATAERHFGLFREDLKRRAIVLADARTIIGVPEEAHCLDGASRTLTHKAMSLSRYRTTLKSRDARIAGSAIIGCGNIESSWRKFLEENYTHGKTSTIKMAIVRITALRTLNCGSFNNHQESVLRIPTAQNSWRLDSAFSNSNHFFLTVRSSLHASWRVGLSGLTCREVSHAAI